MDGLPGGKEEFVVVDVVEVFERNFVLIIEGKKDSVDDGMKQCLLSMEDIWDNNGRWRGVRVCYDRGILADVEIQWQSLSGNGGYAGVIPHHGK